MRFLIFFILIFTSLTATSKEFYILNVKFHGLKNVPEKTIINNLKPFNNITTKDLLIKLVETRLFDKVKITIKNRTLNIYTKEKPYIKSISVYGDDKATIKLLLNDFKLRVGHTYEHAMLKLLKSKIKEFYFNKGFHNSKIRIKLKKNNSENFVNLKINTSKNKIFKIKKFEISGNKYYSKRKILSFFTETSSKWTSFFVKNNLYIRSQLSIDVKKMKSFYQDHGFIDFQIHYIRVLLDKNKKDVSIFINISEGSKHRFGKINLVTKLEDSAKKKFENMIKLHVKENDIFSNKAIAEVKKEISSYFQTRGLLNAKIDFLIVNTDTDIVNINFKILFSRKVKVKKVFFIGNNHTNDTVLRRFLKQMEESLLSIEKINSAKQEILKHGLAKKIELNLKRHPKNPTEVDVILKIKEHKVNKMIAGLSYSVKDGITFNINSELINFLGSGKDILLNLEKNKNLTDYNLSISYPNFLDLNIDLHYSAYYRAEIINKKKAASDYSTNAFGFSLAYSFKIRKNMRFNLALCCDKTYLRVPGFKNVPSLKKFICRYGLKYKEYSLTAVYVHSTLNKSHYYPSNGATNKITIRATTPISKLKYYILNYDLNYYKDLSNDFILNAILNIAYGNKYKDTQSYPFFRNFSLKGKTNVRGYTDKTLGPRTFNKILNLGGNYLVSLKLSIFFPLPIISQTKKIRTGLFFDVGHIYDTNRFCNKPYGYPKTTKFNSFLKYSCGLSIAILTPIGLPIELTFAYPLNSTPWDKKEVFTFTLGLKSK